MLDDGDKRVENALAELDELMEKVNTLREVNSDTSEEGVVDLLMTKVVEINKYIDGLFPEYSDAMMMQEKDPEGHALLWKEFQETRKNKHVEIMGILRVHIDLLEHGAKQRIVGEYDDELAGADGLSEVAENTDALDGEFRKIIRNTKEILTMMDTYFGWETTDSGWEEGIDEIESYMTKTIDGLDSIFGIPSPFFATELGYNSYSGTIYDPDSGNPRIYLMLKSVVYGSLISIFGELNSLISYQKEVNNIGYAKDLFSREIDVDDLQSAGITLVEHSKILAGFDYSMNPEESEDINDLLNILTNSLRTYAATLESLSIGEGKYKPKLSDVNSHMATDDYRPRKTYQNLGMWPLERKQKYNSLSELDLNNWLGLEQHSETFVMPKANHGIEYRDFIDYIQALGYTYKKVTHHREHRRLQPVLSTFEWNGTTRKFRPNATIYFHHPHCPIAETEMRIAVKSESIHNASISCYVGLDLFFQKINTSDSDDKKKEQQPLLRDMSEKFIREIMKQYDEYQCSHGLLKNSKFDATIKELDTKGRTFDDVILSDSKKQLLEDNVFTILSNSQRLIERGVETNRGIMLAGPPGVGKSLTIDAVISKASCTVIFANFKMLHEKMEGIFEMARRYAPTILLLEDIDALGITGQRGLFSSGAGLSTLLNCMDGINSNNGVITIATSNHPEQMDWALIARPGRFDVRIDYLYPDKEILKGILKLKLSSYACEPKLDLNALIEHMPSPGFTGSHIQDIVNQANYICISDSKVAAKKVQITQSALKTAVDRSLYNFNKFLAERPHVKLKNPPTAGDILKNNNENNDYFG
jgi:SpoVK/Ycf46/Vps4 family AAA+-type ATPase